MYETNLIKNACKIFVKNRFYYFGKVKKNLEKELSLQIYLYINKLSIGILIDIRVIIYKSITAS
jgi:hypothetical protein